MSNVTLNNWFTGELVDTIDMKLVNNEILQVMYSDFGGQPIATGCTPTITSSTEFSVSGGAVFFGQTNDATYISRTGTNLQFAIISAQAGLSLVNPNCSIVITPVVTYAPDNRTTTITGVVSSKVTPASTDYVLATVASGAITAINSISNTTPSTTQRGYAQYATNAQAITGAATNLVTTASNVKAVIDNLKSSSNTWTGVNNFNGIQNGSIGALMPFSNFGGMTNYGSITISTNGTQVPNANLNVIGNGDSSGYGLAITTPNGVYAVNGASQFGAIIGTAGYGSIGLSLNASTNATGLHLFNGGGSYSGAPIRGFDGNGEGWGLNFTGAGNGRKVYYEKNGSEIATLADVYSSSVTFYDQYISANTDYNIYVDPNKSVMVTVSCTFYQNNNTGAFGIYITRNGWTIENYSNINQNTYCFMTPSYVAVHQAGEANVRVRVNSSFTLSSCKVSVAYI